MLLQLSHCLPEHIYFLFAHLFLPQPMSNFNLFMNSVVDSLWMRHASLLDGNKSGTHCFYPILELEIFLLFPNGHVMIYCQTQSSSAEKNITKLIWFEQIFHYDFR